MPVEQDTATGKWWDTDLPPGDRYTYDTQQEALDARQRRDVALGRLPKAVWQEIGEYVGAARPVGVNSQYLTDPGELAHLAQTSKANHALFAPVLGTTKLIEETALLNEDKARGLELEEQFTAVALLEAARTFANAKSRNTKLPATLALYSRQAYELRGIVQRAALGRFTSQKDAFLRTSATLGLDVVELLRRGMLANPDELPGLLSEIQQELTNVGNLGKLAEYLTLEEEAFAGRLVVLGPMDAQAWRDLGAAEEQLPRRRVPEGKQPEKAARIGGDRTTYQVGDGELVNVVTTQQKLVQHRADVSRNIVEALGQLLGSSNPPELPLLTSLCQVHIILPYPQFDLPAVAAQVREVRTVIDASRTKEQQEEELKTQRAAVRDAIGKADPVLIDSDTLAIQIVKVASERLVFAEKGFVLLIDTPAHRYRVVFSGEKPEVTTQAAAPFMARLVARLVAQVGTLDRVVAAAIEDERRYVTSKITKRVHGQTRPDSLADDDED
jgi:hypothetical protein